MANAKTKTLYTTATMYKATVDTYDLDNNFIDNWSVDNIIADSAEDAVKIAIQYIQKEFGSQGGYADVHSLEEMDCDVKVCVKLTA